MVVDCGFTQQQLCEMDVHKVVCDAEQRRQFHALPPGREGLQIEFGIHDSDAIPPPVVTTNKTSHSFLYTLKLVDVLCSVAVPGAACILQFSPNQGLLAQIF